MRDATGDQSGWRQGCMMVNTETIPIIDLGPYLSGAPGAIYRTAEQLHFALTQIGSYFIVNHGVPSELRDSAPPSAIP
jgi:isopenicillin N synthase-like dioxygenase